MLIDIEKLNGNESVTSYAGGDISVTRCAFSRPSSLSLKKKIIFNPTLPTTPESFSYQERSYCSLPRNNLFNFTSDQNLTSKPPYIKSQSVERAKKNGTSNVVCCSWLTRRWHRYLRKSSPRRDVVTSSPSHDIMKSLPFMTRRRAATVSTQPSSLLKKESKRDWGEERHNDVIYKVVLKKVIQDQNTTENPSSELCDGVNWVTQKFRSIKGATLSHLVGQLCRSFLAEEKSEESNFLTVFFSTYRSFANSTEVLDLIVKETEKLRKETSEKRISAMRSIILVLQNWLERYFEEDFYMPPHHLFLKRFVNLAEEYREDKELSDIFVSSADQCDFLTFAKSKLQIAEVKGLQEVACENMNSPSIFSDILDETEDVCVEEESTNTEASRTLLNFLSSQHIAEQLTVKDANLLLRVVPHHCLVYVRSSKNKPASVKATIEQFNKVTFCVQGTCLCLDLKPSVRAKVISKWIEVAQVCLELKNFSSFHAIISGLRTHPIYRLKRTWQLVSSNLVSTFEELSRISIKDSVIKAGLSKGFPDKLNRGRKDGSLRRHQTLSTGGSLHGTVPYLGTFLTDLTYLHTAKADYIEKNIINFNKMRKEFEMLAQLQLWQASCRSYQHFESDQRFCDWFNSVTLPTDDHAIVLSEQIEPLNTTNLSPTSPAPMKKVLSEMLANQFMDVSGVSTAAFQSTHRRTRSNEIVQVNEVDVEQTSSRANGHVVLETPSDHEQRTVNVQIIKKVAFEPENSAALKQMELCSNDRSPAFMKKVFCLFEMESEDIKNFTLVQILPEDKRLVIPETGNVYYAMNSSTNDFCFALIEEGAEAPWDKRENRSRTLTGMGKGKKVSRKTASTSSVSAGVSPMKSIYKHFGISLTSGFHSTAKDLQRRDSNQDGRDSLRSMTPDPSRRKASADDSLSSSNTTYSLSDESAGESDPKAKGLKKLIGGKRKGHRRNHSDLGQFPNLKSNETSPVKIPVETDVDGPSSLKGHPVQDDFDKCSRPIVAVGPNGSKSLPAAKINSETSSQKKENEKKQSKSDSTAIRYSSKPLRKQESRSKFYIPIETKQITHNHSTSSFDSAASIESKSSAFEVDRRSSAIGSHPHAGELVGENEVFGDEVKPPLITVQLPSPQNSTVTKFPYEPNDFASNNEIKMRPRCASETRTTPL